MELLIEKLVASAKKHNQLKSSRPTGIDDVSGICFLIDELRKNGYVIKGFAKAAPNSDYPVIRKDPITNTYEIRMNIHCPIDECKKNFALAVLAIIKGSNFVLEVYDTLSSIDDLFLMDKNFQSYYDKLLSVL